ncbi:unnamed protein product [Coregonus sp. 'balchen']|nr:unnamed protein product [Coregonus sp. 'balchen']
MVAMLPSFPSEAIAPGFPSTHSQTPLNSGSSLHLTLRVSLPSKGVSHCGMGWEQLLTKSQNKFHTARPLVRLWPWQSVKL